MVISANGTPTVEKIKRDFYRLFGKIVEGKKETFLGIGLLVYDSRLFDNLNCFPLRPSLSVPANLLLNGKDALDFLLEASSIKSPMHDGFILFNEKGLLTHAAQYFGPPPVRALKPDERYGTRYHAVMFGSCLEGVIISGGITSGNHYYIFEHGELKKNG